MVNSAPLRVRPGTARDVPVILKLIRGLATYERRRHVVKITAGRVRRDGFGRRPYFKTLICLRDGEPVGFALYFFAYSTFLGRPILYLEDLFVVPRHRGRGAGKTLLAALARVAVKVGCGRMTWSVLRWNVPAIEFYRRLGADPYDAWMLMSLRGAALQRLARTPAVGSRRRASRRDGA